MTNREREQIRKAIGLLNQADGLGYEDAITILGRLAGASDYRERVEAAIANATPTAIWDIPKGDRDFEMRIPGP